MLGILCGLASEAAAARAIPNTVILQSCADMSRAQQAVQQLINLGATRLLSFGLAGGLAPDLTAGTIIIGTNVRTEQDHWSADAVWAEQLAAQLPKARLGRIWGSSAIVTTPTAKAALYQHSQCLAVDMESQNIAAAASTAGLPFAVLRAIIDTAAMVLPPAALVPLSDAGQPRLSKILASLARQPSQLPDLLRLVRANQQAMLALQQAAKAIA
jgi:hopanoid-associated phosphorylase